MSGERLRRAADVAEARGHKDNATWLRRMADETFPHPVLGAGPISYVVHHWCTVVPCRHDGTWECLPDDEGLRARSIAIAYLGESS